MGSSYLLITAASARNRFIVLSRGRMLRILFKLVVAGFICLIYSVLITFFYFMNILINIITSQKARLRLGAIAKSHDIRRYQSRISFLNIFACSRAKSGRNAQLSVEHRSRTAVFQDYLKRFLSINNSKQIIFSPVVRSTPGFTQPTATERSHRSLMNSQREFMGDLCWPGDIRATLWPESARSQDRRYLTRHGIENGVCGSVKKINQSSKKNSHLLRRPGFTRPGGRYFKSDHRLTARETGRSPAMFKLVDNTKGHRLRNPGRVSSGYESLVNSGNLANTGYETRAHGETSGSQRPLSSQGIRFVLSGRLNGVRMARKFRHRTASGKIKSQTFLDPAGRGSGYIHKNVYTKWGILGLRI